MESSKEKQILENRVCNAIYCLLYLNRKASEYWKTAWEIKSFDKQESEKAENMGNDCAKKAVLIESWIEEQILNK